MNYSDLGLPIPLGTIAQLNTVTEANITLSNVATGNVSITAHGFAPILPNNATEYLDGTGNYSTPAGGVSFAQVAAIASLRI